MPKIAYHVVYKILRQHIESKIIPSGNLMPSENTLAKQFNISRTTARKVLQMLADDGYIASRAGVGWEVLSPEPAIKPRERQWVIGVDSDAFPGLYYYHQYLLEGIKQAAREVHCRLVLCNFNSSEEIEACTEHAVIVINLSHEYCAEYGKLAGRGTPVIFVNREFENPKFSGFAVDYRREASRAVEYLLLLNHRRIAMVAGPPALSLEARVDGWYQAFAQAGLEAPTELLYRNLTVQEMAARLKADRPTAAFLREGERVPIFAMAAERAGLRIPEDISLICFDDMSNDPITDFPVSHIRMPLHAIGRQVLFHAVDRLENPELGPCHKQLEADLVINSSCRRLDCGGAIRHKRRGGCPAVS